MNDALLPAEGWGVLHLFFKAPRGADAEAVSSALKSAQRHDQQVVTFSLFGHKADMGVMVIGTDFVSLRHVQGALQSAGLDLVDSYISMTEVSEYAKGMPPEHLEARLHPTLPPDGKRAFCFYPMSKRRLTGQNWYGLDFEERKRLMMDHGRSGRRFAGRVVQLITGSTGLDDFEWGVTLFGEHPDDLKEVVYTMRFDEASATYAEFGAFYTGIVGDLDEVLAQVGLR